MDYLDGERLNRCIARSARFHLLISTIVLALSGLAFVGLVYGSGKASTGGLVMGGLLGLVAFWMGIGRLDQGFRLLNPMKARIRTALESDPTSIAWIHGSITHMVGGAVVSLCVYVSDGRMTRLYLDQDLANETIRLVRERSSDTLVGFSREQQAEYAKRIKTPLLYSFVQYLA